MTFYPRIGRADRAGRFLVAVALMVSGLPGGASADPTSAPNRGDPVGFSSSAPSEAAERAALLRQADGDLAPPRAAPDTFALRLGSGFETATRTVALAGALLTADLVVRRVAEAVQSEPADELAGRAKWLGTWRSSAPVYLVGGAALSLALEGPEGLKKLAAVAAGALAGSTANEIVNVGLGRHRPRHEQGSLAFRPLRGHASFPSGHTAYVFAMAAAVDEVTEGTLPAVLAYGAATATGLSRIYHDSHWFSDVAVGAVIGLTVSRAVTAEVSRRLDGRGEGPRDVTLVARPGYMGVRVSF